MSAIINSSGTRQLDGSSESDEQVTPEQWEDVPRMTRLLMAILRDVARLRRRFSPDYIEHEDVVFDGTGTEKFRLAHGMGGRVRWTVTDWSGATAGPRLVRHADTNDNTLVLVSYTAGTGTIRIQRAG